MNRLLTLTGVALRQMLLALSPGKKRGRTFSALGALAFLAGLGIYISGVYSFMLVSVLGPVGLGQLVIPLMSALTLFMSFFMTAFAAGGLVFGGRDNDLLLSLPVSVFTVLLSRVLALFAENFIFSFFMLAPAAAATIIKGVLPAFPALLTLLPSALLITFLPTALALVVGYLVNLFSARASRPKLFSTLFSFLLCGGIIVLSMSLNGFMNSLVSDPSGLERALSSWLLPCSLTGRAIGGELSALALLAVISLLPFLLVVWLFSLRFKAIVTGLSARRVRSDYRITTVGGSSRFAALYKMEASRYFGTTVYVTNTAMGLVMLLMACVYAIIKRQTVLGFLAMTGLDPLPLAVVLVAALVSMTNTTAVSISLEGKYFWIIRESPVKAREYFAAKAALNLSLTLPVALICAVALSVAFDLGIVGGAAIFLISAALSAFGALFGLFVNLKFPRLDADNDTVVVKQSLSSLFGIFGGMVVAGALALVWALALSRSMSFYLYALACLALLIAATALFWRWLMNRGARELARL